MEFALIGILVMSMICAAIGAVILDNKGRSAVLGAILGFLFSIIGLIICLAMDESVARTARRQAEAERYNRTYRRNGTHLNLHPARNTARSMEGPVAKWLSQPRSRDSTLNQTPQAKSRVGLTVTAPEDHDQKIDSQHRPSSVVERLSNDELDAILIEILDERKRRTTGASE